MRRKKKNHPSHSLKRILGPYSHIWERAGGKEICAKKKFMLMHCHLQYLASHDS